MQKWSAIDNGGTTIHTFQPVVQTRFDVADRERILSLDFCGTLDQAKVPRPAGHEANKTHSITIPHQVPDDAEGSSVTPN